MRKGFLYCSAALLLNLCMHTTVYVLRSFLTLQKAVSIVEVWKNGNLPVFYEHAL